MYLNHRSESIYDIRIDNLQYTARHMTESRRWEILTKYLQIIEVASGEEFLSPKGKRLQLFTCSRTQTLRLAFQQLRNFHIHFLFESPR